jgi:peptidylprolyl isomerase
MAMITCIANQHLVLDVESSHALGFKKDMKRARRNSGVSMEDYQDLIIEYPIDRGEADMPKTLKYYDLVNPSSVNDDMRVHKGDTVLVHFDCIYKKIDAVSTRSARLLGENRVIAEPFQFIAGSELNNGTSSAMVEGGGGLFSGQRGPKPPQALSYAVIGMARGGKRSVLVPASLGYKDVGEQEIPPNCDLFELIIEVL